MHKILHKTIFGGDITDVHLLNLLSIYRVKYVEKVGKKASGKICAFNIEAYPVEKIVKNDKFSAEVSFGIGWK